VEPGISQAWHCAVHAELQQYPSTQFPFWHWALLVQGVPLACVDTQLPPVQVGAAAEQSAFVVQLVRQAVPPVLQAKFPGHGAGDAAGQLPEVSHVAAGVSVEPEQVCERQETLPAGNVHAC
jgi:hypothetical protein